MNSLQLKLSFIHCYKWRSKPHIDLNTQVFSIQASSLNLTNQIGYMPNNTNNTHRAFIKMVNNSNEQSSAEFWSLLQ